MGDRRYVLTLISASMMIAMGLTPAAATASAEEPTQEELLEMYGDEAAALVDWERQSSLSEQEATDLLQKVVDGEQIDEEMALELGRYLRDNDETPVMESVVQGAMNAVLQEKMLIAQQGLIAPASDDPWHQGDWNTLAVPLTAAYLAAGTVVPELSPIPHDITLAGLDINARVDVFVEGGIPSFTIVTRIVIDIITLITGDAHYTTDALVLQVPIGLDIHVHFQCIFFFGIPLCFPVAIHVHILDIAVASDAEYVFAYPVGAGEIATRATDNDLLQVVYDILGNVNFQEGHELTSISPVEKVPAVYGAIPGGLPGVGDLHAVAPTPNYYGLQKDGAVPNPPGLPPTPPQGDVDSLKADYADIGVRNRGGFGTAPHDQTGITVGYEMTQIRTWTINLAVVRWKDIGLSAATLPQAPASFYFDAAGYYFGGTPTPFAVNFALNHAVP